MLFLLIAVLPSLAACSFSIGLKGEGMGFLLGVLLALAVIATLVTTFELYMFLDIVFIVVGVALVLLTIKYMKTASRFTR